MSIKQKALIVLQVSIYLLLFIAFMGIIFVSDKKVSLGILIGMGYMAAIDVVKWIFKGV